MTLDIICPGLEISNLLKADKINGVEKTGHMQLNHLLIPYMKIISK